jgi:hypothetical protein
MRSARILGGLVLGLTLTGTLAAQQTPAAPQRVQQRIMLPEVDVRSGPSLDLYATAKLKQNEPVVVLGPSNRDPKWLRIEPPQGSFSWVNARDVKRMGPYAVVQDHDDVPVLAGSTVVDKKPSVVAAKLKRGNTLVVIGDMKDGNTTYLAVQPTEQEVRYIPADSIKGSDSIPLPAKGGSAAPAAGVAQAAASDAHALILQANSAYQSRDYVTASRLYNAAIALPTSSYAEKAYCYNQLAQLAQPTQPATVAAQQTSQTKAMSPSAPPAPSPLATLSPGLQWSAWGRLRKTAIQKDGKPVYVLEDGRGQPLLYAVAYPNMTLDPHVGKMMTMYGNVDYWSNQYLRTNYMTVSQIALMPTR